MKRSLIGIVVFFMICCFAVPSFAQTTVSKTATFEWQQDAASIATTGFGGWKLYRKTGTATYTLFATIPYVSTQTTYTSTQTLTIPTNSTGTLTFVITAFNTAGESAYSTEATYTYDTRIPGAPTTFRLTITVQ